MAGAFDIGRNNAPTLTSRQAIDNGSNPPNFLKKAVASKQYMPLCIDADGYPILPQQQVQEGLPYKKDLMRSFIGCHYSTFIFSFFFIS